MKVELNATAVLALLGVAGVGLLLWKGPAMLARGASAAADAVNPLNHDNIFAGSVNAVGGAIVTEPDGAGKNADGSWTLGGWIYDITHDGSLNPASANNVIYRGVNGVGGAIVTDPAGPGKNADGSWSLGGWLYDVTH